MNPLVTTGLDARRTRTALSVNVNRVALLRNTRALGIPSVTHLARLALEAGAHGITVHPRPDARHVRAQDVYELATLLKQWPQAELNIEGNPFHNLMDFVRAVRPQQCTFVPDSAEQATSDHGWQLATDGAKLAPLVAEAKALGVRVSLFMDPMPPAMRLAREVGADRVELYTESYARAYGTPEQSAVLAQFAATAQAALREGLGVNAGHDLNRVNLGDFLRAVPGVQEVSIGHALNCDALELGYAETVRDYLRCIERADMAPKTPSASSPQGGASSLGRPGGGLAPKTPSASSPQGGASSLGRPGGGLAPKTPSASPPQGEASSLGLRPDTDSPCGLSDACRRPWDSGPGRPGGGPAS